MTRPTLDHRGRKDTYDYNTAYDNTFYEDEYDQQWINYDASYFQDSETALDESYGADVFDVHEYDSVYASFVEARSKLNQVRVNLDGPERKKRTRTIERQEQGKVKKQGKRTWFIATSGGKCEIQSKGFLWRRSTTLCATWSSWTSSPKLPISERQEAQA